MLVDVGSPVLPAPPVEGPLGVTTLAARSDIVCGVHACEHSTHVHAHFRSVRAQTSQSRPRLNGPVFAANLHGTLGNDPYPTMTQPSLKP